MSNRLELQSILEGILGNKNVYFQPPASVRLSYPCVIYNLGPGDAKYADDRIYNFTKSYDVIFIYKNPNLDIIDTMLEGMPLCRFSRSYIADGLNHYAFTLYF